MSTLGKARREARLSVNIWPGTGGGGLLIGIKRGSSQKPQPQDLSPSRVCLSQPQVTG